MLVGVFQLYFATTNFVQAAGSLMLPSGIGSGASFAVEAFKEGIRYHRALISVESEGIA